MDPATAALIVQGGIVLSRFVYNTWIKDEPKARPTEDFQINRSEEGSPVPLVFGKVRVRAPILAWAGPPSAVPGSTYSSALDDVPFLYTMAMYWVLGIGFPGGTQKIHRVWAGDIELVPGAFNVGPLSDLTGDGNNEHVGAGGYATLRTPDGVIDGGMYIGGAVEFLNGKSDQLLTDGVNPLTVTASRMNAAGVPYNQMPGYRGCLSALFHNVVAGFDAKWSHGTSVTPRPYSFEVSSYPDGQLYPAFIPVKVGDDANPADVAAAILCDAYGKLGRTPNETLGASFKKAGETLLAEGHGYSRVIEERMSAADILLDIARQTDGVFYEDPATGLIAYKLIRADYDPNAIPRITPANCERLENFTIRAITNLPNMVRVTYTDRDEGYVERSATAQNQANAVGQDGLVNEVQMAFPGCSSSALAETLAARELAIASFPARSCRAIVDRSFIDVNPGDVVSIVWPEYKVSFAVFRVANVDRGGPDSNAIALDLIEDYFNVYRRKVTNLPPIAPFPTQGSIE